jgi:hypothetical protein
MMDTVAQNGEPTAAQVAPPKVRMDKSRSFSTVHGERGPDDKHQGVCFIQDGIPCDAQGYFIFDHPDMLAKGPDGDKRRKMADKHIKRAIAQALKNPPKPVKADDDEDDLSLDADADEDEDEDEDDGLLPAINLGSWLRGEQEVEWNDVSQEIARTYKKRISKEGEAVEFLVAQGVATKPELRKKFQKFAGG